MKRGEVWWWRRPDQRSRPACIVTRDEAIPVLTSLLIVPATTTRRGIATEVELDIDDGMPIPCVLALDAVTPASKALLTDRITELSPARMHQVCLALRAATAC
jgi:mRNA interferase MazF